MKRDGAPPARSNPPEAVGSRDLRAMRVMLVEDDVAIADPLARALRREGYAVELTPFGEVALERISRYGVDLLVLDLGLPDLDGLEVCRRLRKTGSRVPVLVLTARADEVDTVVGLDAGADDYVPKPFRLAELLARVRALLRRGTVEAATDQPAESTITDRHGIRIDPRSRRAWHRDEELHLTAKEFDLLRVLHRDAGRVVTREQLMHEVWETTWWTSTKTLDMHISWLRRKLGDDASRPRYIVTVRGVGFRFEVDAPEASEVPDASDASGTSDSAADHTDHAAGADTSDKAGAATGARGEAETT